MRKALLILALIYIMYVNDWALVIYGTDTKICATSFMTCETAREAISKGYWGAEFKNQATSCVPSPNCFAPEENCIKGYNCQRN